MEALILRSALSACQVEGYYPVHSFVVNPKSVSLNELYGAYDLATFEWADGILSTIFKSCAENDKPDEKYVFYSLCITEG
jgi:dynein heavy chain, axonemal